MTYTPPFSENIINKISRQIIGLSVKYQIVKKGQLLVEEHWLHFTGFIYSENAKWYWVSAGHVFNKLKELNEYEKDGRLRINYYRLRDRIGINQNDAIPIPFNFYINKAKYIFKKDTFGVIKEDIGFYELYYLVKKDLESNGIKPFTTEKEAADVFNEFYLLGIPNELINTKGEHTTFSPVIIPVGFIKKDNERASESRFIFGLPEDLELNKLEGMSGGPVIGFPVKNKEKYYLIGIQVGCKENIIIVCPVNHFIAYLQKKTK